MNIIVLTPALILSLASIYCRPFVGNQQHDQQPVLYGKNFDGGFRAELADKLSEFVEKHNSFSDDKINTHDTDEIYFINKFDGKEAYFVDFAGDSGYAVIDKDWTVNNLTTSGQYESIDTFDGCLIFESDGTIHGSKDGEFFDFAYIDGMDQEPISSPVVNSGTDSVGHINDIDAYIADAHPDFDYENIFYLVTNYHRSRQYHTSVLYKYSYDQNMNYISPSSEGNCLLNSVYSSVLNGAKHGWNANADNLGSHLFNASSLSADRLLSTLTFNRSIHYSESGSSFDIAINAYDWGIKTDYYLSGSFSIPKLYWHIRERALDFGYACEEFYNSRIPDLYGHAYIKSGYSNPGTTYSANVDSLTSNIRKSLPGVVATTSSNTYGNHGMAVYGYKVYSVTQSFLWFTEKYYKYVFLVDDGHTWGGTCPVSDSAILSGNLNSNTSYTLDQKRQVRWYDPTCATSNGYYSQNSANMVES